MRIAITGASGFIGRYIVHHLLELGHDCQCWHRPTTDLSWYESPNAAADDQQIAWVPGQLGDQASARRLVENCDAVVHSALYRPGAAFRGGEGDLLEFARINVMGTLQLVEAARESDVGRFVFISTCAVHEQILNDRPLDEAHPLWPTSHYGAHKAAIEKFIHSYGLGHGYNICSLRPTGVYGIAHPVEHSKWYPLVRAIVRGEEVECRRGGKEIHAADVARAVGVVLTATGTAGQAYNCYDRYVSEFEVAEIAKRIGNSESSILGQRTSPKNQIETGKIRSLGMAFGGRPLLEATITELVAHAKNAVGG